MRSLRTFSSAPARSVVSFLRFEAAFTEVIVHLTLAINTTSSGAGSKPSSSGFRISRRSCGCFGAYLSPGRSNDSSSEGPGCGVGQPTGPRLSRFPCPGDTPGSLRETRLLKRAAPRRLQRDVRRITRPRACSAHSSGHALDGGGGSARSFARTFATRAPGSHPT